MFGVRHSDTKPGEVLVSLSRSPEGPQTGEDFDGEADYQLAFGIEKRGWPYFRSLSAPANFNGAEVPRDSALQHYLDVSDLNQDIIYFPGLSGSVTFVVRTDGRRNLFSLGWTVRPNG